MPTVTGVPKVQSDPRAAVVAGLGIPSSALTPPPDGNADRWAILVAAAGGKSEVKVTYDAGPPLVISRVETA